MRFKLNSIYTARCLNNMAKMAVDNAEGKKGRDLYYRAAAEIERVKNLPAAPAAPLYDDNKPWIIPEIKGNLSYHKSFASVETGKDVQRIVYALLMGNCSAAVDDIKAGQGVPITQYLLKPTEKTTYAKLLKLSREFKAAFDDNRIRLYQDGAHVVVEVPGDSATSLRLADVLMCDEYRNSNRLSVAIGKSIDGTNVIADIEKMPHMLVAGTTGSGKSVFLQGIILSLLMKHSPKDIDLYMVDPKMVEFSFYSPLPMCHVVTEVQDAIDLLSGLCDEMDNRYLMLASAGVRDIDGYNKVSVVPMKRTVVFIDELADLIMKSKKTVEDSIVRIAQKARACGIHLIIATQRPTVNVVTGLIKANIQTRVCFAVSSAIDSCVMLDKGGAEQLLGKGDMLYRSASGIHATRLQGGFVEDYEIRNVVFELSKNL